MSEYKIVQVKNLSKSFNRQKVLDNISFDIGKNEIVGFIGPNGAGKSTTMKCLCSLLYPDSGEIIIDGHDLKSHRKQALEHISSMIEYPGLFSELTGRENITMVAQLKKVTKQRINEIVEFVDIGKSIDKKVTSYSLGMKQRLGLGIAILNKPKFLILDEPMNGLDPTGVINLRNTLKDLMKHGEMSILFSSHQLGEIERLADRIICINKGKIVDTPSELDQPLRYMIQFKSPIDHLLQYQLSGLWSTVEFVSVDIVKFSLSSGEKLNELLRFFMSNDIELLDIHRDVVDIETLYRSVYEVKSEV